MASLKVNGIKPPPVIGPALSTPYATGYSTLGALVPKLSASAIIKKDQLAIKRQEERERLARSSEFTRWWPRRTCAGP